jgi:large subunit ribosomal protein L35
MVPRHRRPKPPTPPQSNQKEAFEMPKFKPHSGMAKRVKVTGKGKLLTEQAGKRHLLEGKSSKVTRRMTGTVEVAKVDAPRIKKMLGR